LLLDDDPDDDEADEPDEPDELVDPDPEELEPDEPEPEEPLLEAVDEPASDLAAGAADEEPLELDRLSLR
jgi:hypothetical protein